LAVLAFALASLGAVRAAVAADPDVELGPDFGAARRVAASGYGVTYDAAFAYGAHIQVPIARLLRFTAYYARIAQRIDMRPGALGIGAPVSPKDELDSYVIGARLQPTVHLSSRLRLWLDLGAAWGVMTSPVLHVDAAAPYEVGRHPEAFAEFPFGAGGEFDWWPERAGVTVDVTGGLISGGFDQADRLQTIDASGRLVAVPPLPSFSSSWSATLGIVLHL
jgi:hypothetical protein